MSQERIDALKGMAVAQPAEPMIWYGLANEYVKLEKWDEAVDALRRVVSLNADFTAAYQLFGTALMNLGQREAARQAWSQGIDVANRTGAWKARQHMEGLLASSAAAPDEKASGFCTE